MVGIVARIRLSSVTLRLLSRGTLKSTRMRARLPLKLMSLIVFISVVVLRVIKSVAGHLIPGWQSEVKVNGSRSSECKAKLFAFSRTIRAKKKPASPAFFTQSFEACLMSSSISETDAHTFSGLHQIGVLINSVIAFCGFLQRD